MNRQEKRDYQREWISKKRDSYFKKHGPCLFCGSEESLVFHHINPAEKDTHRIWSWTQNRLEAELLKCVVVCKDCHDKIHALMNRKPLVHGTMYAYTSYKCRCDKCRAANAERKRNSSARKWKGGALRN